MDDNALRTLALAFTGAIALPPGPGRSYAFLNARAIPDAPRQWRGALRCEQGFRPDFLDLVEQGYDVAPVLQIASEETLSGAVVLAGRLRQANEIAIARAWNLIAEGGPVLVVGTKRDGIQSLRKWVSGYAALAESLSKHHAVVFSFQRRGPNPFPADRVNPPAALSPAMFSAAGADPGSQILAEHFDRRISGAVADFGAGSGFLCRELLLRGAAVARLDAYEADYLSLQAARQSLAGLAAGVETGLFWRDLLREPPGSRYDWIVMNPPFHRGRAALPEIGSAFIGAASRALLPGGRLLMVANRNLPYESTLAANYRQVKKRFEDGSFKIYEAVR